MKRTIFTFYIRQTEVNTVFEEKSTKKSKISKEYKEFKDIFMPPLIRELPEHGPFDHKIKLMDGKEPIFKLIY